jgi:hypothetical protein
LLTTLANYAIFDVFFQSQSMLWCQLQFPAKEFVSVIALPVLMAKGLIRIYNNANESTRL